MGLTEQIITIGLCILGTVLMRVLPFVLFSGKGQTPAYVTYLGKYLPVAVFGMLIIYCLKDVDFSNGYHGVPELIAIAVTAGLHIWKRITLLSIAVGTGLYLIMVNFL